MMTDHARRENVKRYATEIYSQCDYIAPFVLRWQDLGKFELYASSLSRIVHTAFSQL